MIGGDITDELSSDEEVQRGLRKVLSHKYQDFKRAAQITAALQEIIVSRGTRFLLAYKGTKTSTFTIYANSKDTASPRAPRCLNQ